MKMFALYLVCVACDVGMSFKYNLEGRVYMRNKLVKLSIECNTVYIHYITLHYITLHNITLHYITFITFITLHYTTLHYITLHYIHA